MLAFHHFWASMLQLSCLPPTQPSRHWPSLCSQKVASFPPFCRFSRTPAPASRAAVHQAHYHPLHHHPMPEMANAFVQSTLGLVFRPWTCFYAVAQRGDGGYSPLMARNPDVPDEAPSAGFLEHRSVDFGRLGAFRGWRGFRFKTLTREDNVQDIMNGLFVRDWGTRAYRRTRDRPRGIRGIDEEWVIRRVSHGHRFSWSLARGRHRPTRPRWWRREERPCCGCRGGRNSAGL